MSAGQIRNPQLADLATQLEAVKRHGQATAGSMTPAQLEWRPDPKSWGVAQCLEHLILTMEANELQVPGKIAAARSQGAPPVYAPWKSGWIGKFIINGTRPGSRPVPTAAKFVPVTTRPDVLRRFMEKHDMLMEWIRSADGLDVTRVRITSPFLAIFRYHLGDCLTLNVVHAERHLQQADRVKARPGFPKA